MYWTNFNADLLNRVRAAKGNKRFYIGKDKDGFSYRVKDVKRSGFRSRMEAIKDAEDLWQYINAFAFIVGFFLPLIYFYL